ncbi:hypothetical protein NIES2098_33920 [Calothrix sp. NIES-2098]|nr:hypothetical protein NIES2098_33920 [Calothrix sp. NIES-2098]
MAVGKLSALLVVTDNLGAYSSKIVNGCILCIFDMLDLEKQLANLLGDMFDKDQLSFMYLVKTAPYGC